MSAPLSSLWLLPAEPDAAALRELQAPLRARWGGPRFPPHLTLLGSLGAPPDRLLPIAASLAASLPPLTLRVVGVEAGERFFRCVYLRTTAPAPLRSLRGAAGAALGEAPRPGFLPHVSLLYADLSPEERAAAAAAVRSWPSAIRFGALAVVRTSGPVGEWAELGRSALSE